jgi:hypothetical protein
MPGPNGYWIKKWTKMIRSKNSSKQPQVLKSGTAMRVVFFYPGEEGTYVDNVNVTIFENGIVNIESPHEETTTHIQNCEVLWNYATETEEGSKLRLLKPKKGERGFEFRGDPPEKNN